MIVSVTLPLTFTHGIVFESLYQKVSLFFEKYWVFSTSCAVPLVTSLYSDAQQASGVTSANALQLLRLSVRSDMSNMQRITQHAAAFKKEYSDQRRESKNHSRNTD